MYYLGLDFGTSGCRACILEKQGRPVWQHALAAQDDPLSPAFWRYGLACLADSIPLNLKPQLAGIAIDATSGTLLLTNDDLELLGSVMPYSAPYSGPARLARLLAGDPSGRARHLLTQADYINSILLGFVPPGDIHNQLKCGFDPVSMRWQKDWLPADRQHLLREVVAPGTPLGPVSSEWARQHGLPASCQVMAGTTDSIAAFLAAGVHEPGTAVTSLGSTLAIKVVSPVHVDSARHGAYSHWFGKNWLAGGASNTGGRVLRQFFSPDQLYRLSRQIDPETDSPFDLYPLPAAGERFPLADPDKQPVLSPRPADDAEWLKALLQGMSNIELTGYRLLQQLGAPYPARVLTSGGGSRNPQWTRLRERLLQVPVDQAICQEAACGAARLALQRGVA